MRTFKEFIPPPPPKAKFSRRQNKEMDPDFSKDFSKERIESIINWEIPQDVQKPKEIKNKIKNEVTLIKKSKNEDTGFHFIGFLRKLIFKIC
jgi:hypothetical protein